MAPRSPHAGTSTSAQRCDVTRTLGDSKCALITKDRESSSARRVLARRRCIFRGPFPRAAQDRATWDKLSLAAWARTRQFTTNSVAVRAYEPRCVASGDARAVCRQCGEPRVLDRTADGEMVEALPCP